MKTPVDLKFKNRTFAQNLGLGSCLAFIAGVTNSVAFLAFGGYVSHISGNTTRAAVEYSEGHFFVAGVFFAAIFFFMLGSTTTTMLLRGHTIDSRKVTFSPPLIIEALIIGFVAYRAASSGKTIFTLISSFDSIYVHLLSFSMGMQNAILRQASGAIVRTTHVTGMATDMGIAIGTALVGVILDVKKLLTLEKQVPINYLQFSLDEVRYFWAKFKIEQFFIHFSLFLSFTVGCGFGAFGFLTFAFHVLIGPVIILLSVAFIELRSWRKRTVNELDI